jgi:hypothetical protein
MSENITVQQNNNTVNIQQAINQINVGIPGLQGPPGANGIIASAQYATSAGVSASTTQTNFNSLTISSSPVATQNFVTGQGYQTSSGSVAYASKSASSTYSSSAGAAPIPASVSYAASAGAAPIPASVSYSASAGAAPIPASVSYSASTGIANNSINLGGQASSYYYPASSITTASVNYATNSGSSNYSSSAGAAPIPASVSYSASSGQSSSVNYSIIVASANYAASAGSAPIPASVSYSASSDLANNSTNLGGQASTYYAPISSPTFTGVPLAPTAASATNTTQIATTAFVRGEISNLVNSAPTTLDTLNELAAALGNDPNFAATTASAIGLKAPIANPSFTGTPLAPTAASGTATTQIATTQFVQSAIATQAALSSSTGYYGAFSSSTTQTTTANTAKAIVLEQNDGSNGVSVNSSSITFTYPGVYNIQWSGQFENTNNSDQDANVWVRKNGVDVAGSNGIVSIPAKHGSTNGHTVAAWNYIFSVNAGDVFQFYWMPDSSLVTLQYYPISTVASTQSVIVTAQLITYIQQGSSITGGSATNVTFIGGTANFNSASISGSSIATVPFVTSQGYLTSSGSIATASNSLLLNNLPSSSFAQLNINNNFSGSNVFTSVASTAPITVKGAVSQTANLQEWQDSSGNVRSKVDALGNISASSSTPSIAAINSNNNQRLALTSPGGGPVIEYGTTTTPQQFGYSGAQGNALTFQGTARPVRFQNTSTTGVVAQFTAASTQTGDFTQWAYGVDSGSTVIAGVSASGQIYTGASTVLLSGGQGAQLSVQPSGSLVGGIIVRQYQGMLPNLMTFQDYAGNTLAAFASNGQLGVAGRFSVGNGGAISNSDAAYIINGSSTSYSLRVKSPAGIIVDHFRVENSAGQSLFGVASAGYAYAGTGTFLTPNGRSALVVSGTGGNGSVIEIQNNNAAAGYSGIFLGASANGAFAQIRQSNSLDTNYPNYLSFYTAGTAVTALAGPQWMFQGVSPIQTSLIVKPFSLTAASALIFTVTGASATGTGTASIQLASSTGLGNGYTVTTTGIVSTSNPTGAAASAFNQNRATVTVVNASVVTIPITLTDTYTSGGTLIVNQTADLQQWQGFNSNGVGLTALAGVNWNGQIYTGSTSMPASVQMYIQQPNTSTKGLVIKSAGTGANVLELQNNIGNTMLTMSNNGILIVGGNITVASIQNNNSTSPYINWGGNNSTRILLNTYASANIGFIIQGVASQTGDLQQWQDSTGSVLSRITGSGTFIGNIDSGNANFTSASISGSVLATQAYVNNKVFYETIPFSVTGSVSTAGPWDYRFYNDTGGTRSIVGVRASVGTAPTGSAMIIDVRKNGTISANSIFTASGISIPISNTTSGLISSGFNSGSSVASGDYLTVAVTQVGSTIAGSDLVVQVMWS